MPRAGPKKTQRYGVAFKRTAEQLFADEFSACAFFIARYLESLEQLSAG